MAFVEIYPNNESGRKYGENYFKNYEDYNACCDWYEEGNEIVVILDTKTGNQAVYERFGNVCSTADRFDLYLYVDVDREDLGEHNEEIRKVLVQEALEAGFPERCPAPMPKLHEYMVKIRRVCNVSVMATGPEQAQRIGENLAGGHTSLVRDTMNAVMYECDDEFYGVGSPENERCNLSLGAEDSMRVLNGEE